MYNAGCVLLFVCMSTNARMSFHALRQWLGSVLAALLLLLPMSLTFYICSALV